LCVEAPRYGGCVIVARLLAPLVVLVVVTGCTEDDPTIQVPTSPAPGVTSASPTASPTPTSTLPPGVDQVVSVTYRDGDVTGPSGRVKVKRGDTVQLVVTSDKADEVHLHGYDKKVDVAAGGTVRLTFRATIPGVFEAELEHLKVRLVRLQVQ